MADEYPNPAEILEQARGLSRAGQPDRAVALLKTLPDGGETDPLLQVSIALEMQRNLLACADDSPDPVFRLALFFRAQTAFYRAIYIDPCRREAYRFHAEFWRRLGRDDMAARLLRSILYAAPDPACRRLLETCRVSAPGAHETPIEDNASREFHTWREDGRPPRLLVLTIPGYDPGMDVLFDGLCTVLGPEYVTEFPYKPLLHGQDAEAADDYPTTFNHPGTPRSLDWICEHLRAGHFDVVLFADLLKTIPRATLGRILAAGSTTPWAIVDGWDDASNNLPLMREHLAPVTPRAYFKREMIAGVDYGREAIPFPLSYPDGRVPRAFPRKRTQALFWAGNRYYGQRRLYLEHVEAATKTCFNPKYTQQEYIEALQSAHVGLCLFGFGFDTVRYYEIPAHGALLLAERPPIRIPFNFVEGRDAVFFDDLPDLLVKLDDLFQNPHRIPEIACEGHRHFLRHHTASARARQLLRHLAGRLRH